MINIAIVGFGNIGRGVKKAVERNADMKLAAISTRRLEQVTRETGGKVPVFRADKEFPSSGDYRIDVAILCGGSEEDIPVQGPEFAEYFSTVDGFDLHKKISTHFQKVNAIAKKNGNVCIISAGWDPGIFSLERIIGDAFLPGSKPYTFWGEGVSQGHSNAARKVKGVLDARQYTIPIEGAIQRVRAGETPEFSKREMHRRMVWIVAEEGADKERIRREIVEMPEQFDEYDTEVRFISKEEMDRDHSAYPHGGFVMTSGITGDNHRQILEYRCLLENNPEFTASILVACARAAYRLNQEGQSGAFTMLDFPLGYLSLHSGEMLRSKFM